MTNLDIVSHCLHCKNARCQKACPIYTDIPSVIAMCQKGEIDKASAYLFENNPLSVICSIVCDHRKQCFGNCILNIKNNPVPFYQFEKVLSEDYLLRSHFRPGKNNGIKVSIIGAGPAGIAASIKLALKGFQVNLYDDHEKIGGVLRYGIPSFRLPKTYVDAYERIIDELNINFTPNFSLSDESFRQIRAEADYVVICCGAWKPKHLNIRGEASEHVKYAISFLENPILAANIKNVVVIGGGNVAIDAARTLKRLGKGVSIYYRKEIADMPCSRSEIEEALAEGVVVNTLQAPVEIKPDGVVFSDCKTVVDPISNRKTTILIPDTDHLVKFDFVVPAISQSGSLDDLKEIKFKDGLISAVNYETSVPNVFACGDIISGPNTVVSAVYQGKKVAEIIADKHNGDLT